MALSLTHTGANYSGYTTSLAVASFTPTANSLLLLSVYHSKTEAPSSITGHGTWVLLANEAQLYLYGLLIGGSPSASTVTVTWATNGASELSVDEVLGHDDSSTANAVPQAKADAIYDGGGGPHLNSTTFDSAFGDAANFTYQTAGSVDVDKDAGFTSLYDASNRSFVAYKSSEDATVEYTQNNNFITSYHIIAEIAAAAAAPSGNPHYYYAQQ